MISPPFDFNVRVKMFIIIMLIFSFLLAYFICLDMLLLLLLLFKFSLFVCLFVFLLFFVLCFFVLQIWFVNTYRLSAISYQCPMGHRKPRGVSKGERLRLSWFLYWKKPQFCCSWYYILNYWFQSNFLSKSYQNQLQYCTFTLLVNVHVGLNFESKINAQTNKV